MPAMTLRQLEYLVAVAEERSFTRAAQRLHVSQPALSHQVRVLEQTAGGALLQREPRTVGLTTLGEEVLPHARAAVELAQAAAQAARRAGALEGGELRVATLYSIALGILPPAVAAWRRAHPDVRVELLELPAPEALSADMARGAADVAVGPVPDGWDGPRRLLGEEAFLVVLPADDKLLRSTQAVPLWELANRPWVLYPADSGLTPLVERACAAAGFRPRAAGRTRHTNSAVELAAAGLGPALVPAGVVGPAFAACARLADPPVSRRVSAFTRPEPSPPAAAFLDTLVEHARIRQDAGA